MTADPPWADRQQLAAKLAPAIRRYVGGVVRYADDADALSREAVAKLAAGDFAGVDPNRDRFRDVARLVVRAVLRTRWTKVARRRPTEADLAPLAGDPPADPAWDAACRAALLDAAWAAVKAVPGPGYALLRLYADHPDESAEELADRLFAQAGKELPAGTALQTLHRARIKFAETVRDELRPGLADPTPARLAADLAALGLPDSLTDFPPTDWTAAGRPADTA